MQQGEEPRYNFDPKFTDPDQKNFHWTVVMDYSIHNYKVKFRTNKGYVPIRDEVKEFMMKFPINLDGNFSEGDHEKPVAQRAECIERCQEFWTALKDYYENSQVEEEEEDEEETLHVVI